MRLPADTDAPLPRHAGGIVVLLIAAAVVSFGMCAVFAWGHIVTAARVTQNSLAVVQRDIAESARRIDRALTEVVPVSTAIADSLSAGTVSGTEIVARLRDSLSANAGVDRVGVAYARFAYEPSRRLYAPLMRRLPGGTLSQTQIEDAYDYTQFRYRWFGDSVLDGRQWSEPTALETGGPLVALFTAPFFRPGANADLEPPLGLVLAGIDLGRAVQDLDALKLGTSGYAFVFTREGRFVRHPRRDLVQGSQTIFETSIAARDTAMHSVAVRATRGESGIATSRDEVTGQTTWIVYQSIPSTGWTLAAVLFHEGFLPNALGARRGLFQITLTALVGLLLLALAAGPAVMLRRADGPAWALSMATAGAMALAIGALWLAFDRHSAEEVANGVGIYDEGAAEQFLDTFAESAGPSASVERRRIPTGVFVRSIEFAGSNNVLVGGEVWQRFPRNASASAAPGFRLVETESASVSMIDQVDRGDEQVRRWSFSGNFRQQFSYARYPFDRQSVWVRLEPAEWARDAVLVPDFGAYQFTNPLARPGVTDDLVLPGWDVLGSFFAYRVQQYNTDFGMTASPNVPQLFFHVSLRRQFVGPFIANLLPVAVTAAMLFGMLLITTRLETQAVKAMDIVLGTAALFVVASFQHIALRNALNSPRVFYFEYFYFALYLSILLVTLNGILFAASTGNRVIDFRDNLIPKLAFWPGLLGALFAATFWVLY